MRLFSDLGTPYGFRYDWAQLLLVSGRHLTSDLQAHEWVVGPYLPSWSVLECHSHYTTDWWSSTVQANDTWNYVKSVYPANHVDFISEIDIFFTIPGFLPWQTRVLKISRMPKRPLWRYAIDFLSQANLTQWLFLCRAQTLILGLKIFSMLLNPATILLGLCIFRLWMRLWLKRLNVGDRSSDKVMMISY